MGTVLCLMGKVTLAQREPALREETLLSVTVTTKNMGIDGALEVCYGAGCTTLIVKCEQWDHSLIT